MLTLRAGKSTQPEVCHQSLPVAWTDLLLTVRDSLLGHHSILRRLVPIFISLAMGSFILSIHTQ